MKQKVDLLNTSKIILAANEKKVYTSGERTLCGFLGVNLPSNEIDIINIAEFTKGKIEKALQAINGIIEAEEEIKENDSVAVASESTRVRFNEEVEVREIVPPAPSPTSPKITPIANSLEEISK